MDVLVHVLILLSLFLNLDHASSQMQSQSSYNEGDRGREQSSAADGGGGYPVPPRFPGGGGGYPGGGYPGGGPAGGAGFPPSGPGGMPSGGEFGPSPGEFPAGGYAPPEVGPNADLGPGAGSVGFPPYDGLDPLGDGAGSIGYPGMDTGMGSGSEDRGTGSDGQDSAAIDEPRDDTNNVAAEEGEVDVKQHTQGSQQGAQHNYTIEVVPDKNFNFVGLYVTIGVFIAFMVTLVAIALIRGPQGPFKTKRPADAPEGNTGAPAEMVNFEGGDGEVRTDAQWEQQPLRSDCAPEQPGDVPTTTATIVNVPESADSPGESV